MVLRVLNIAEKPSAAKEIVGVFRRGAQANVNTRQSRSRYNVIYEFDTTVASQPAHMLFTSVLGHLKGTEFEDRVRQWGSCDPMVLLNPSESRVQWGIAEDKEALAQTLRTEARSCDWLILWLDCDSEGEKIAVDVADVCREGKPSICVKRARFSAMTNADIFRAIGHLEQLNYNVSNMVSTRQEIDLRAGSAYTRFLTKQLEKFVLGGEDERSLISYGPCQFPTLGIIVDRWLQIKNFISRDFWVFELFLRDCDIGFDWVRKQVFDEYTAYTLYELAEEEARAEGYVATVEHVQRRQRNRWRPLPLCTVDMQKAVSRLMHMSSDRTMDVAEALYNKGLISYPRTETDKFATSYNLRLFVEKQTGHSQWGQFATRLLSPPNETDQLTFTWPRAGRNDDGAHPPIHPTNVPSTENAFDSADHRRLYDYITKRFLACCSIDARGSETIVRVRVGGSEHFTAQGLIVEEQGYLEVMVPFERWTDKQMPTTLLQQYARIPITSFLFREGKTQPPPLLTEADLIALMDHHRIGTDATIAEHIKKVQDRNYVEKLHGGRFNPTDIGLALVIAHERCQIHLARPHMRASQENQLKRIANQSIQPQQVLDNVLTEYRNLFQRLKNNRPLIDAVFHQRFDRMSAQTWQTVTAQFSRCGTCAQMMQLKSAARGFTANNAMAGGGGGGGGGGGRGRGRGRGTGRGRGRGTGQNSSTQQMNCDRCVHCTRCDRTLKVPRNGQLQGTGKPCMICQYEVIEVTTISDSSGTGNTHTCCPKCYNEPPTGTAVNPEGKTSEFRCFMCTQTGCEFATGTTAAESDVAKCPLCGRPCAVRSSRGANNRFVTCTAGRGACSFVYWFPRDCIQTLIPVENQPCQRCQSKKFVVDWIAGKVPFGTRRFTGCIWCDGAWPDVLQAIGEDGCVPTPPHPGAQGRGRGRGGSANGSRNTGRFNGGVGGSMDIEDAAGRGGGIMGGRGRGWGGNGRQQNRGRGLRGQSRSYQNRGRSR